jgi:hypothetical protein
MGQSKGILIQLANISDILAGNIGKGDSLVAGARKNISAIVDGYTQAIAVYQDVANTANKYLDMARALGDDNMIGRLTKNLKDANEMIKACNQAIAKAKSV